MFILFHRGDWHMDDGKLHHPIGSGGSTVWIGGGPKGEIGGSIGVRIPFGKK